MRKRILDAAELFFKTQGQAQQKTSAASGRLPGDAGDHRTVHRPDRIMAAELYHRGVSATVVENAFVLAASRRASIVRRAQCPWAPSARSPIFSR